MSDASMGFYSAGMTHPGKTVELAIQLVSEDGALRELFECSFGEEEWDTIRSFHSDVELLRSTNFVQQKRGGTITFSWKVGQPITSLAKPVDSDEFWLMLLKLRPFVLQKERHYFHKIKKLFSWRLHHHPAFQNQLEMIGKSIPATRHGGQGEAPRFGPSNSHDGSCDGLAERV